MSKHTGCNNNEINKENFKILTLTIPSIALYLTAIQVQYALWFCGVLVLPFLKICTYHGPKHLTFNFSKNVNIYLNTFKHLHIFLSISFSFLLCGI